jgi:hypothetical protein
MLIAAGLLPFIAAEFVLRWSCTSPTRLAIDPCLDSRQVVSLFELNGVEYHIRDERLRFFAPATFAKHKGPNTKRVFCLGGSTTQGEPYKPPTAFPAWLQYNLELMDRSHSWEVINCGGLSYASYRLLPILYEVLHYSPDLIVVDCGHNEFLEDREFTRWHEQRTVWQRAIDATHSLRLVQFASACVSVSEQNRDRNNDSYLKRDVDALLDDQGGLEHYHRHTLKRDLVETSFRWNIEAMIDACQKRGVPILCLVPTANLRDCPPFKVESNHCLDTKLHQAIETHWASATALMNADTSIGDTHDLTVDHGAKLDAILEVDPLHAGALFASGLRELENGNHELAHDYLARARDADVCPLRASSSMQQSVRSIAKRRGVWCLDVDTLFQSVSRDGIVGNQWLVDHVHPRLEGHQLMGEQIAELLLREDWVHAAEEGWREGRPEVYRTHLRTLGEDYFVRGKQRLAGLMLWTQGRARKGLLYPGMRP